MIRSAWTVVLLALVLSAGCVVVPVGEGRTLVGRRITGEQTAFIRAGTTTRREVIGELGEPTMDFAEQRIVAYGWEELGAYMVWGIPGGGCGIEKVARPYVLLIAFDADDRVIRFENRERWSLDTIEEHAVKWAKRQGLSAAPWPAGGMGGAVPAGRSVICIYRAGGWDDWPGTVPSVIVDGRVVAELRRGRYVAVVRTPGTHSVLVDPVPGATPLLRAHLRPTRSISIDAPAERICYLEVKIRGGFGAYPVLRVCPPEQGERALAKLRRVW